MWKLLLISAIFIIAIFSYINVSRAKQKSQLKSFRYTSNSSLANFEEVFEAKEDGKGYVKLLIKSYDDQGNPYTKTARVEREAFMAGLEKISYTRKLHKWNGFSRLEDKSGNNDGFRFEADFSNAANIKARGTNSVPEGYGPAVKEIKSYFKQNCK